MWKRLPMADDLPYPDGTLFQTGFKPVYDLKNPAPYVKGLTHSNLPCLGNNIGLDLFQLPIPNVLNRRDSR